MAHPIRPGLIRQGTATSTARLTDLRPEVSRECLRGILLLTSLLWDGLRSFRRLRLPLSNRLLCSLCGHHHLSKTSYPPAGGACRSRSGLGTQGAVALPARLRHDLSDPGWRLLPCSGCPFHGISPLVN